MKTGSFLAWLLLAAASFAATPVPVFLDTDMSGDCDDVGTLALLHALADRGECDLLAVVTNRRDLANASAAAADAIDTFYGRPDLPVGVGREPPTALQRTSLYTPALRDGFPHDAKPDDEMPDALDIYRTVLAAQPDGSVTICGVGPALRQPSSHRRRPAELRPGRGPLRRARPRPRTLARGAGRERGRG
jgi:hypothetical protein